MLLRPGVRSAIFYALGLLVCLMTIFGVFATFLPNGLATQIGHNREAVLLALLLAADIQYLRPWLSRQRQEVLLTFAYGAALIAFGWWLLHSGLSSDYFTFSESFFGAGALAWYVQPRRPFRLGLLVSVATVMVIIVFFDTYFVLDQAENLLAIILGPLAFDLFDRRILDRDAPERPLLRAGWTIGLIVGWFVFWRLAALVRPDLSGFLDYSIDYIYRAAESYLGFFVLGVYFSYWLGRSWRDRKADAASPDLVTSSH